MYKPNKDDLDVRSFLSILWSKKLIVISAIVVSVLLGHLTQLAYERNNPYEVKTKLYVTPLMDQDLLKYIVVTKLADIKLLEEYIEANPEASFFLEEAIGGAGNQSVPSILSGVDNPISTAFDAANPWIISFSYLAKEDKHIAVFVRYIAHLSHLLDMHIHEENQLELEVAKSIANPHLSDRVRMVKIANPNDFMENVYVGRVYIVDHSKQISKLGITFGSIAFGFFLGVLLALVTKPKRHS
jgi:hypothetical protein